MQKRKIHMLLILLIVMMPLVLSGCGTTKDTGSVTPANPSTPAPSEAAANNSQNEDGSDDVVTQTPEAVNLGPAKLFYLGHASVRIETSQGKVIYIDPWAGEDYEKPADLVLITHYHGDHYGMDKIKKNDGCKVIESFDALKKNEYKTFDEQGISIKAVPAANGNHKKAECVGYVLEFDGIKLYHAGDTSKLDEMADLAALNLNYALLPMDDVYNMGPEEAAECAALIKAKHTIPIHTGPDGIFSEENIAKFNVEGKLVVKPGEEIELSIE